MGVGWHLLEVGQAWAETRLGAKSGPGAWLPAGGGGVSRRAPVPMRLGLKRSQPQSPSPSQSLRTQGCDGPAR